MLATSRSSVPFNHLSVAFKVSFKCTSNSFSFVLLFFPNSFVVSAIFLLVRLAKWLLFYLIMSCCLVPLVY